MMFEGKGRILSIEGRPLTGWSTVVYEDDGTDWRGAAALAATDLRIMASNLILELEDGRRGEIVVDRIRHSSGPSGATAYFLGSGPPPFRKTA